MGTRRTDRYPRHGLKSFGICGWEPVGGLANLGALLPDPAVCGCLAGSGLRGHSREIKRRLWLLPLADVLAFLVWLSSFFGSRVDWHGKQFHLDRRGRMTGVAQGEQQAEPAEEA